MSELDHDTVRPKTGNLRRFLILCLLGLTVNLLFSKLALLLKLPLYLDVIGVILTSIFGGYVPGIIVGFLSIFINALSDSSLVYYAVLSVLIAVITAFFAQKGWLANWKTVIPYILLLALVGGGLGSVITLLIYGSDIGNGIAAIISDKLYSSCGFTPFFSQITANFLIDIADKAICVLISLLLYHFVPQRLRSLCQIHLWCQNPMSNRQLQQMRRSSKRRNSIRFKVIVMISVSLTLITIITTSISLLLYHRHSFDAQTRMGEGITQVMEDLLDADRVDEFMNLGYYASGYAETMDALISLRESSLDIEYVYVYKILPDGCHVVFDPDTEDTPGGAPGEVIEFDQAFMDYLPALLAGEEIVPIVSNERFGWLLSIYRPIYDSQGKCVCYACVDISMRQLYLEECSFLARVISLFLAFFILILACVLWAVEYTVILPINSISQAAGNLAFTSEAERQESVKAIESLQIRTGDEVETLYEALCSTSEQMVQYVSDVQEKNETISRMQNKLIEVLADMVESRDKYTGDHVKMTALYSQIIMKQLRKEGLYTDILTDEYIENVIHSAPLHDIGKIKVSDTLLNKPGKLTDEEFVQMKNHTRAGEEILDNASGALSETGYLGEAKNLAAYHHEHWDGTGYPYRLHGDEIPLSARIMAVADVFDALVSKRSYKEGFPIDKAFDIIREGVGTHFDPKVAKAFLDAEEEVRRVAAMKTHQNTPIDG